jgi:Osmosensitive K+ channel His kinase sensor domain
MPAARQPRRWPSAIPARSGLSAWCCHWSTGTSASTASGEACSQPNAPAAPPAYRKQQRIRRCADVSRGHCVGEVTMSREQAAGPPERAEPASSRRLRVYVGFAPSAGTTCAMLNERHQRAEQGTDVVVACPAVHGRPRTAGLLAALEVMPRQSAIWGTMAEELDLDAVLAPRPAVALWISWRTATCPAHVTPPAGKTPRNYRSPGSMLSPSRFGKWIPCATCRRRSPADRPATRCPMPLPAPPMRRSWTPRPRRYADGPRSLGLLPIGREPAT